MLDRFQLNPRQQLVSKNDWHGAQCPPKHSLWPQATFHIELGTDSFRQRIAARRQVNFRCLSKKGGSNVIFVPLGSHSRGRLDMHVVNDFWSTIARYEF